MANTQHLGKWLLGIEVWNKWRDENPNIEIDLSQSNLMIRIAFTKADLTSYDFSGANLTRANLSSSTLTGANLVKAHLDKANLAEANLAGADLSGANLAGADLTKTILSRAILTGTHLSRANLLGANLFGAKLVGAELWKAYLVKAKLAEAKLNEADFGGSDFSGADLRGADLSAASLALANLTFTDLTEADLSGARLSETNLTGARIDRANFSSAKVGSTIFGNVNLAEAKGLEQVVHIAPSTIGTDTLTISKGKIPLVFLRGCGLGDWEIEQVKLYNPDLSNEEINNIQYKIYDLRATQALQISPLFVSYSHKDSEFVDKVGDQLTKKGIRYWRDIHDMKVGRIETQIDKAIRQNPTVLLVLSEHSLQSDWVEHEVRTARGLEKEVRRDVLCPVALDDSWKGSHWPKRVMEQIMEYNILDFSAWKDGSKFDGMFRKLIDGLELFYKG